MRTNISISFLVISTLILLLTIWFSCNEPQVNKAEAVVEPVSHKVIQVGENIWGYEIYKQDQLFIRQTQIPCLAGNVRFATSSDAEKVAVLVEAKILEGKLPMVTLEELQDLDIAE